MTEIDGQPDAKTPLDANNIGDAPASGASADYSLRSSGSTYIERAKEAHEIVDRIKTSSASVIGIAGVRGAGKSSLAKKVLGECDASGFFTLLIPSPTEYDPKDFLLAIFQRIGEHATERIQKILEGAESLARLGDDQSGHLRTQRYVILIASALFFALGVVGVYWVYQIGVTAQMQQLTEKQTQLSEELLRRVGRPAPVASKDKAPPLPSAYPRQASDVLTDPLQTFRFGVARASDGTLFDINHTLEVEIETLKAKRGREVTVMDVIAAGGFASIFCLALFAVTLYRRISRRLQIYREHRTKVGLLSRCKTFRELIKYQSVLASGTEFSFAPKFLSFFSSKFSSGKQLEDRPLSLPGLTATCSEFLRDVAEVFSGKVVICIDELDKITDVAELFRLLKGIKGILGQENTHFILTVSEDAMAFFNERLSRERSLVESSFEEIIYLDRLTRDVSTKVIRQSLVLNDSNTDSFLRNCAVQWAFAGGIPREIKRNLFTCYSRGISMDEDSSFELWRLLYLGMLNSMLAMSTPKEVTGVEDQYRFLICIETLIERVRSLPDASDFGGFMRDVLGVLRQHFSSTFRPLLLGHPNHLAKAESLNSEMASSSIYFAQLVEALIGAIILAIANNDISNEENDAEQLDLLIYVYKYVPINPRYAFYGLNQFLGTKLKMLELNLNDLVDSHPPKLAA